MARKLVQSADTHAVPVGVDARWIEQNRLEARTPGAHDVDLVEITDVNRRLAAGTAPFQRDLEEPTVRFLDLLHVRVKDGIEIGRQSQSVKVSV
jgi:hypothetical protein